MLWDARLPCHLVPAQITGATEESSDETCYRIPKRDLVVGLQVLFQHWPFEIVKGSPATDALIKELAGFRAKRSSSGHTRYEGAKDDLTMALALAWWWEKKQLRWNPCSSV